MALDLTLSPPQAALLGSKQRGGAREWAGGSPGSSLRVSSPANRWPLEVLGPGQPSAPSSTGTWFSGRSSQLGGENYVRCRRQGRGAGVTC